MSLDLWGGSLKTRHIEAGPLLDDQLATSFPSSSPCTSSHSLSEPLTQVRFLLSDVNLEEKQPQATPPSVRSRGRGAWKRPRIWGAGEGHANLDARSALGHAPIDTPGCI